MALQQISISFGNKSKKTKVFPTFGYNQIIVIYLLRQKINLGNDNVDYLNCRYYAQ